MEVKVFFKDDGSKTHYMHVTKTYSEGGFYCLNNCGDLHKIPISNIIKVIEYTKYTSIVEYYKDDAWYKEYPYIH